MRRFSTKSTTAVLIASSLLAAMGLGSVPTNKISGRAPLVNLITHDGNVTRSIDSDLDVTRLNANEMDGDSDLGKRNLVFRSARQNQHGAVPFSESCLPRRRMKCDSSVRHCLLAHPNRLQIPRPGASVLLKRVTFFRG